MGPENDMVMTQPPPVARLVHAARGGDTSALQVMLGFLPAAITFLAVSISMLRNPSVRGKVVR